MNPIEIIRAKRVHIERLANQKGASGELAALERIENWLPRPKGLGMRVLLKELAATGIVIRPSSFDAISAPCAVDFQNEQSVREALPSLTFIEIKTSNQLRVKPGFDGFFFAITESEITAADQLGPRHRVALFNRLTEELLLTTIPEIVARSSSATWQLSVQL